MQTQQVKNMLRMNVNRRFQIYMGQGNPEIISR